MSKPLIILLIILGILLVAIIIMFILGRRAQKKQEEQREQIEATKQTISMLIIDKKRLPMSKSGLPQIVIDNTPFLLRRSKVPVVKAKVGPKILNLVADEKIFDDIPIKKEVKAQVSGIYIVDVKGIRKTGGETKKPGLLAGFRRKLAKKADQLSR